MKARTRMLGGAAALAAVALAGTGPLTAHAYDVDGYVIVMPFTISRTVTVLGIVTVTVTINSPLSLCAYVSADSADPITPEVGAAGTCPASGTGTMTLAGCSNGTWSGTTTLEAADPATYNYSGAIVGGIAVLQGVDSNGARMVGVGTLTPQGDCVNGVNGFTYNGFMGQAG